MAGQLQHTQANVDNALLELAAAAHPVAATRANPTARQRVRLADAVVRVLIAGRLGGLAATPKPSRDLAFETFRAAFQIAAQAGVPRTDMVAVFNSDDGAEPVRKDLQ